LLLAHLPNLPLSHLAPKPEAVKNSNFACGQTNTSKIVFTHSGIPKEMQLEQALGAVTKTVFTLLGYI